MTSLEIQSCERCGYKTSLKYNLKRHYQSKTACKNTFSDKPVAELLADLDNLPRGAKQFHRKNKSTKSKFDPIDIEKMKEELKRELKEEMKMGPTYDNSVTVNVNFIGQLRPFGQENTEYITPENICKLLTRDQKGRCTPANLLKVIHFNKNHPENHNLLNTSIQSKYVSVFDGTHFVVKSKKDVLFSLLESHEVLLADRGDAVGNDREKNKVESFREKIEECVNSEGQNDPELTRRWELECNAEMYNGCNLVKDTNEDLLKIKEK